MLLKKKEMRFLKMSEIPVKVGQVVKLIVSGFGKTNDPFFKIDKYILFLKSEENFKVEINRLVELKVTKVFKTWGFVEIHTEVSNLVSDLRSFIHFGHSQKSLLSCFPIYFATKILSSV